MDLKDDENYLQALPSDVRSKTLPTFDETSNRTFDTLFSGGEIHERTVIHLAKSKKKRGLVFKRHNNKRLSLHERRKLGLYELEKNKITYKDALLLNNLWQQYMKTCLDLDELQVNQLLSDPTNKNFEAISLKLYRADYHGANVSVVRSTCPNYIGLAGIVLMETKNCFRLVDTDNIVRTVPKAQCEFKFKLDKYEFMLNGSNFQLRPADRSSKKIKTVKLFDQ